MSSDADADAEGVRRTLAAYCHTVDDGHFEQFADWFADDAVVEVRGDRLTGRAAISAWIEHAMPAERRGRHVTVNSAITVDGERAHALSDFLFFARTEAGWQVTATGRYEDDLVRAGDRWLFARRTITLTPGTPRTPGTPGTPGKPSR